MRQFSLLVVGSLRVWLVPLRKLIAIQTHDSKKSAGSLFEEHVGEIQVWNAGTYSVLEICPKTDNFLPTKSKNTFLVNQKPSFPENLNKKKIWSIINMNRKYSMIFLQTVLFSKSSDIRRFPSRYMVFKIWLQFCFSLYLQQLNLKYQCSAPWKDKIIGVHSF